MQTLARDVTWLMHLQASDSAAREQLERVVEVLDTERCENFEDCISWARHKFQVGSLFPCILTPVFGGLVNQQSFMCPVTSGPAIIQSS
jgi:hypothetical protein